MHIGKSPSTCPFLKNDGDEGHCFTGMDRYGDFLLLKIHVDKKTLNVERQICILLMHMRIYFTLSILIFMD